MIETINTWEEVKQNEEEYKTIDPYIVDVLEEFNKIPNVITLFSCSGHEEECYPYVYIFTSYKVLQEIIHHIAFENHYTLEVHIESNKKIQNEYTPDSFSAKFKKKMDNIIGDPIPVFIRGSMIKNGDKKVGEYKGEVITRQMETFRNDVLDLIEFLKIEFVD